MVQVLVPPSPGGAVPVGIGDPDRLAVHAPDALESKRSGHLPSGSCTGSGEGQPACNGKASAPLRRGSEREDLASQSQYDWLPVLRLCREVDSLAGGSPMRAGPAWRLDAFSTSSARSFHPEKRYIARPEPSASWSRNRAVWRADRRGLRGTGLARTDAGRG